MRQAKEPPRCRTWSMTEAAQILGIGRTALYEAARRGEIEVIRIGRRLVVSETVIERMLSDQNGDAVPVGAPDAEEERNR